MRIKLDDVINEGDLLISTDFLVEMDIPFEIRLSVQSALNALSAKALSVLCQSVNIPEKTVSTMTVELFGHSYKFRGKREEATSLEMTFVETANMPVYNALNSWFEYVNKSNNGDSPAKLRGSGKEGYCTNIYVSPLTTTGERAAEFVFYNAWIKSTPQMQFTGDSASPILHSVSFEYDYFTINPGVKLPGGITIPGGLGSAIRGLSGIFS
jgi:hypothetical protein